ncbi:MAG: T9SS type A sorting domain-containing protein [Bacteroidota bacterium]
MKRVLLLLLALPAFALLYAQDYQAFRSDREALYQERPNSGEEKPIKGVRVIQEQAGPDSVFLFNPNVREIDSDCFHINAANWLGPQLVIRANGDHLFHNREQDTILLRTQAEVGTQWLAYRSLNDSVRVYASLVSHDTLTHLGLLDSVKTFLFQATDQDSALISLPSNGLPLVIGKEIGLIFTPNFALFPNLTQPNQFNPLITPHTKQLVGLTKPDRGITNLTWFEVHDHQPGDELHVRKESFSPLPPQDPFHQITQTIFRYLDRFEQGDSLGYSVDVEEEIWNMHTGTSYTRDTTIAWYLPEPEFDKLPFETALIREVIRPSNLRQEGTIRIVGFEEPGIESFVDANSCSRFYWDLWNHEEYWEGLGGPYYYVEGFDDVSFFNRELKYYRKGAETWGTPCILTSAEAPFDQTTIQVFPNPTSGEITVSAESTHFRPGFSLILRDVRGRELIRFSLNSPKEQLDLTRWSQGVYLYEIRDEEGLLAKRGKLMIQH